MDIHLDFAPRGLFSLPGLWRAGAKAYDTATETWRHLNFFQYTAYLHARVPRVQCPGECGIKRVEVPGLAAIAALRSSLKP